MAQENLVKRRIIHPPNIPEELLPNILIHLTSKFVVRCKLVCKQWASLISDPFFIRSYLSRSYPSSVIGEHVSNRCIEYDLPKHICSRQDFDNLCLSIDHKRKAYERYNVLGANNGLFLFGLMDHSSISSYVSCNLYYVCNPAIRKVIPLSPPSPKFLTIEWRWGSGLVTRVENGVLESFRVILLLPDPETDCLRFRVYASETQEWNEYIVPSKIPTRCILSRLPTTLNRILHWPTRDGSIIAYDPYANPDRIRVIPPHKDMDARDTPSHDFSCLCDASKGKLRYFERISNKDVCVGLKLWVLEDYDSGLWCMSHETSIRSDSVVVPFLELSQSVPMFFDPFDSDIVYLGHWHHRIMSYDVRTRMLEVVQEYPNTATTTAAQGSTNDNKMFPWYLAFLVQFLPWTTCVGPFSWAR